MKFLICALVLTFGALPASASTRQEKMIADLEFIGGIFDTAYAPKEWKGRHLGWNLDQEISRAKEQVLASESISTREYQRILKSFFQSAKDYHVGVYFHGTERANLPFVVKGTQGRYFLVYIDRQKLSKIAFPFQEGDELLSFDGVPVAQIVESLRVAADTGVPSTDQSLAELYLTSRRATNFLGEVPRGPVMIELKRKADGKILRHQMIWNYVAEAIPEWNGLLPSSQLLKKSENFPLAQMVSPITKEFSESAVDANHPYTIGFRNSYLPALGEKIWESTKESIFSAYIFRNTEGKLIGYIRVPNYGCSIQDVGRSETKEIAECVKEFAEVMAKFEKVTDGLVIDQLNNPGGSVFYLYALASTLSDQPLFAPRHRMAVNQSDVFEGISTLPALEKVTNDEEAQKLLGTNESGYPVTYQLVQHVIHYYRFMADEFRAGRKLTSPNYIWGVDQINPHPTSRYTKPVLMLINSLDFSGGDFFPAILQDNKRITVMGTRTAGAGGYVNRITYPNLFGVSGFSFTASIAERINQDPIENLGVTPDVPYELTVNDLQDGYKDYLNAIRTQISSMVK